jgi:monoamine oxidase
MNTIPIIIIGAGVAGLTIASKIQNEDYIILEARDRIGGRVFTNDKNIDDGAAWVHGLCENPLMTNRVLSEEEDLIPVAECNPWMHSENANITYLTKESIFTRQALIDKWIKTLDEIDCKSTIEEAFSHIDDDDDIRSFLYMIEVWCGGSIRNLPASFLNKQSELFGDYAGSHCLFKNGAKTLIESLSKGCKDKIVCNQIVTKVVYTEDFVEVHTREGLVYYCKKLCITVPPGPLRDIVFNPPLVDEKIEALSRIKMGSYKKIQLEFDTVFWNHDVPMILTQNEDNEYILWNNYMSSKKLPILEAICPADNGWKLVGKCDEDIVDSVMDHLKKYFIDVPFPKS